MLHITDYRGFRAVETGFRILYTIRRLYGDDFKLLPKEKGNTHSFFTLLTGTELFTKENTDIEELMEIFRKDSETFLSTCKEYIL